MTVEPEDWAIYARISYVRRDGDGAVETLGVDRQEPPTRALVERKGGRVARVFVDNDKSAFSGKHRPDYEEMVRWAEEGRIKGIAAWHADRLTRRPVENEALIDLAERYGIKLATVTGEHDLSSPSGRLHFRMLGNIARYESEHKAERLRLKQDELAAEGKPKGGGKRAFGYLGNGVTVVNDEAELLREAARRLLDDRESMSTILADWRTRGVVAVGGQPFTTTVLRRALCSPRVAGLRQHRGEVVGKATWPAILTEQQRDRLLALFSRPDRKRQGRIRTYLYSGFLRCGRPECGTAMVGASQGAARPLYGCRGGTDHHGCNRTWISKDAFEQVMGETIVAAVCGPIFGRVLAAHAAAAGEDDGAADRLDADRAQLAELARLHGEGRIRLAEWLAAREPVEQRIRAAEARQAAIPDVNVLTELPRVEADFRAAWNGRWSLEYKRRILAALLDCIVIKPKGRGHRFDPDRIDPRWRA